MQVELLTKTDLEEFKLQLLDELKSLLQSNTELNKQYYKSKEICQILGISESKLYALRANGKVPAVIIGKNYYYKLTEVQSILVPATTSAEPKDFFIKKSKMQKL